MYRNHRHATVCTARIHATVTDMVGVHRVVTMLVGRDQAFTRFEAEEAGGGRWRLRIDATVTAPEQVELLQARLHRLVSVLTVEVRDSGLLPATA
jgi:acetolactate synthase regulatory subunit